MIKFKNKNNEKLVAIMDDNDEEPEFIKEIVKEDKKEETEEDVK